MSENTDFIFKFLNLSENQIFCLIFHFRVDLKYIFLNYLLNPIAVSLKIK